MKATHRPFPRRGGLLLAMLLGLSEPSLASEAAPPRLDLSAGPGGTDVLSWPAAEDGYYLEVAEALGTPVIWEPVASEPRVEGALWIHSLPGGAGLRLYQLRRDPDLPSLMLDHARKLAVDLALSGSATNPCPDLPFLDSFAPRRLGPLSLVPRVPEGGFVLTPGLWEIPLRSFCLKSGTPSPGEGDGMLPSRYEGPRAGTIQRVLREYSLDPSGDQQKTQLLLWAILLRVRLDSLPAPVQALAAAYLPTEDREALNAAADRKAALEAAFSRRYVRFFLGPGGLFSQLPEAIRESLTWDDAATEALSRSGQLSYEEIQARVFEATPPPTSPEPPRDIAYGRWSWMPTGSAPTGGTLIRYLSGFYDELLVQFCVPERVEVENDDSGRITRLADGLGYEILLGYDAAGPGLSIPGDPGVQAHALASLVLRSRTDPDDPMRLMETTHRGTGWILTGIPSGTGTPASDPRFPGLAERYQWATRQQAELRRLDAELNRVHPGRLPGPEAVRNQLMERAHVCEGLRLALKAAEPEDGPDFPLQADRLGLAYRAWVAGFARYAEGSGAPAAPAPTSHLQRTTSGPATVPVRRRYHVYLDWIGNWWSGGMKAKPASPNQQELGYSSTPTQSQTTQNHQLVTQYQQAVKPVRLLFGFLPLPGFLAINKVTVEGGIETSLNFWGRTTDRLFSVKDVPTAPGPRTLAAAATPDYQTPSDPVFWDPGPILMDPGVSTRRLEATRSLADAFMRVAAHLRAAELAEARQREAHLAGDREWYLRQGAWLVANLRRAGAALWSAAGTVTAWTGVMRDENVDDPWVTRDELLGILQRLRADGFSEIEHARMLAAGLSEPDIEDCLRSVVDWQPTEDGYALFGRMDEMADALREMSRNLLQLPDPAWGEVP